jgi:hypothetical protein
MKCLHREKKAAGHDPKAVGSTLKLAKIGRPSATVKKATTVNP